MSLPQTIKGSLGELRSLGPQKIFRTLVDGFEEGDLLIYASAIAFRVFFSIVPLLLFAFALLGFLHLDEVWRTDIAPDVRDAVSPDVFRIIDDTVSRVLDSKQLFWVTAGLALAIWELSGAVRLTMGALNRAYGADEARELRHQFLISFALAAASIFLIGSALALVKLGPILVDSIAGSSTPVAVISFVLRWGIAILLLLLTIGLIVHNGPDRDRPLLWVSYGVALILACWIAISVLFGLYLTELASYGSLFGNLATVFIAIEYVWLSTIAFVTGILVDGITHRQAGAR